MPIQWKVLLILLLVMGLYGAIDYGVRQYVVLPGFVALEREEAEGHWVACTDALSRELRSIDRSVHDWAAWDDTYDFVQHRNADYVEANLLGDSLQNLEVDFLCIYDRGGRLVWGATVKVDAGGACKLDPPPWGPLPADHALMALKGTDSSVKGPLLTASGPVLVASRPITTSRGTGPILGAVIMGRFIDDGLLREVAGRSRSTFQVWPARGGALPAAERAVLQQLAGSEHVAVFGPKDGSLQAYGAYPDVQGRQALLIRADVPSPVTAPGHAATALTMPLSLAGGLVVLVVTLISLNRTVVGPITRLTRQVMSISEGGNLSARVSAGGHDEVGSLAREFNVLLQAAETREKLLERSHRFATTVAATIPSALVILDADLNIVSANRHYTEQWGEGESSAEVTGNLADRLPAPLLAEQGLLARIRRVATDGGNDALSGVRYASADGGARYCDIRICGFQLPDDLGGEEQRVLLVLDDVTEHNRLEDQVRQAGKMEAIGRLAGGVAHDFNNLLTGIIGYTQLALGELPPDSPGRNGLDRVGEIANRAAALTSQLLAFSRRQPLVFSVVNVNHLVSGVIKMLGRVIGEDIQVALAPDPQVGNVRADRSQVEQVLMNLAVNARDAMPDGGRLTIETADVSFDEAMGGKLELKPGPYVMLSVSDTGCGMDRETQERAFEPFFTTKAPGTGTGLGLATVYGIVKQHDGRISLYSEPGHGTIFRIYLPCVDEPLPVLASETDGSSPPAHGETVLLVEDEAWVRRVVVTALEQEGYRVLAAADGAEAEQIAVTHQGRIDLLLTDVIMPGYNGRELRDRLVSRLPDLEVLYMSGYTDDAMLRQGILDSDVAFIQKPFTPTALARKVREVLDGERTPAA